MLSNPVIDAIHNRRSTRSFQAKEVPSDILETILDAAIWAPSGGNNQTWLFTAVTKPEIMKALNAAGREAAKAYVPDDDYPGKQMVRKWGDNPDFKFTSAPVLIIASNRPNYENAMADCALALENMFLTAESLGLGSCYINAPHWLRFDTGFRDFLFTLGIPKEHTICSSAAIGYIEKASPVPPRKDGTIRII